ncbi:MAG: hypothetical protein ACE14S_00495 [Candidatus Bathyarchaeia archaeon]
MANTAKDFDALLLDSIDAALAQMGESIRQSIFFHLEISFRLKKNEIPQNLPRFQEGLEKIFGVGARFLEILIMQNLYSRIGRPFIMENNAQLDFIKYMEAARQSFLQLSVEN